MNLLSKIFAATAVALLAFGVMAPDIAHAAVGAVSAGLSPGVAAVGAAAVTGGVSASLAAAEALSAKGAVAPRVSLDDINNEIAAENYFTAGAAAAALGQPTSGPLDLLTICILTTRTGFTIIGKSAPASPENFDPVKGQTFAREDAVRQLWPLMGFALRERLAEPRPV